jgi:curved DNA-binding protein CbpA
MLEDQKTYYEILEVRENATPQEIRDAFIRLKNSFGKDSVALYSVFDRDETEIILKQINLAYSVLSNPDKKKEYDRSSGRKLSGTDFSSPFSTGNRNFEKAEKVTSIDRTPPMQISAPEKDILVSPTTDFTPKHTPPTDKTPSPIETSSEWIEDLIKAETDWTGEFLRKVREARGISIEDLADRTKISKRYLKAIESEQYLELPALVFIRGFLNQYLKALRISSVSATPIILDRIKKSCPQKT